MLARIPCSHCNNQWCLPAFFARDLTLRVCTRNTCVGVQGKMIKAAKAEALIRRVLRTTPPGLFQHMMRTINSQVLVLLDTRRSGYVDLALMIMCLLALWCVAAAPASTACTAHALPAAATGVARAQTVGQLVVGMHPARLSQRCPRGGAPARSLPRDAVAQPERAHHAARRIRLRGRAAGVWRRRLAYKLAPRLRLDPMFMPLQAAF